ncbi:hypothetical protein NLU14_06825 [Marinobacter sp. 71-i]|uniref:Uncharacterized protein n=1 Tax=Marinobacter iranensis TaxID=2962607 RepID=A0ABT5Y8C6_9GAMM|nr:hypothetical protein [Marinobacter iranensis]MDF0749940.1 hypothetical protein [Marinobacter iranensis]
MTSLASERSWIMNPSLLKLVHQCRRLIQSEFGVKLHLTEEHLEQQLADYASKSRSNHLISTWEALKPQIPNLVHNEDDEQDSTKRTYRGQVIAEETSRGHNGTSETEAEQARKKKVIYRGQVIG